MQSVDSYLGHLGQCTGLKDQNKVLIFDGDIVNEGVCDYEIFYNEFYGFRKVQKGQDREKYHSGLHTHESLEIIGNIHEMTNG